MNRYSFDKADPLWFPGERFKKNESIVLYLEDLLFRSRKTMMIFNTTNIINPRNAKRGIRIFGSSKRHIKIRNEMVSMQLSNKAE
ncbi:hypothetical protein DC20_06790 [Rufibacter tibetensis]|uniref:Uncharacterized protein n=1 Tax=Rufibacter tibetensis TaxID=512763 RepID=A0A0P0CAX0_9BACT|nr:hypothetical protein DC20_06790 [Rufibacter tibetensis]